MCARERARVTIAFIFVYMQPAYFNKKTQKSNPSYITDTLTRIVVESFLKFMKISQFSAEMHVCADSCVFVTEFLLGDKGSKVNLEFLSGKTKKVSLMYT